LDNQWQETDDIDDCSGLKRILNGQNKVTEVYIEEGWFVNSASLKVLGRISTLTKLELCCHNRAYHSDPETCFDFRPLHMLVKLNYLKFECCYISDVSLKKLCENLVNLQVLLFDESSFEDGGMESLYMLKNLTKLEILPPRYHYMTTLFFKYFTPVMVLKEITFNHSMCNFKEAKIQVGQLNCISTLMKITIYSPKESIH